MEWLNYHHLFYFAAIAEEHGIAGAARKLHVTHSTLSAQLRALETHFGAQLFERRGKHLVLTPFGADAAAYAADIFRLGRELEDVARGRARAGRNALRVGVVSWLPRTLVRRLLCPALDGERGTLVVRQGAPMPLVQDLVAGRLHVVLTDDVPVSVSGMRMHAHILGESGVLLYAKASIARRARRGFPSSLSAEPFVLPAPSTSLRARLNAWFVLHELRLDVRAEVEDAGLLGLLGAAGHGVFPVRSILQAETEEVSGAELVGACGGIHENYYAILPDRRLRHSGVAAIIEGARAVFNLER